MQGTLVLSGLSFLQVQLWQGGNRPTRSTRFDKVVPSLSLPLSSLSSLPLHPPYRAHFLLPVANNCYTHGPLMHTNLTTTQEQQRHRPQQQQQRPIRCHKALRLGYPCYLVCHIAPCMLTMCCVHISLCDDIWIACEQYTVVCVMLDASHILDDFVQIV